MNYSSEVVISVVLNGGSTTPDKNGLPSVFLRIIAGSAPNKILTQTGSVAARNGFEIGKTYLAQVISTGVHIVHGEQFSLVNLGEVKALEIIELINKLGKPSVWEVPKTEESKKYQRITNSVKGFNTLEEEAGNFIRNGSSTRNLSNAETVIEGSSTRGEAVERTKQVEQELSPEAYEKLSPGEKDLHDRKFGKKQKAA